MSQPNFAKMQDFDVQCYLETQAWKFEQDIWEHTYAEAYFGTSDSRPATLSNVYRELHLYSHYLCSLSPSPSTLVDYIQKRFGISRKSARKMFFMFQVRLYSGWPWLY